MLRRPPRSPLDRSSAASDVYKRQHQPGRAWYLSVLIELFDTGSWGLRAEPPARAPAAVSYTHLRAHETVLDLVCRLLLEKTKRTTF